MGRQRTKDDNELLEAARRVFQERGLSASTRDVAKEAGVSQAVLYQRFRTKENLFITAMSPPPPNVEVILGSEEEGRLSPERHLCGIAERLLAYFETVIPAMMHLMTHPAFKAHAVEHAHDRFFASGLVDRLAERLGSLRRENLVGPVGPRAAADALVAALHSMAVLLLHSGHGTPSPPAERVRSMMKVFWNGLRPPDR